MEHTPEWNSALEEVIKKEGEVAEGFFWLHNKASAWAARRNDALQIPVIVFSSITGFLSATTDLVPQQALGAISVLVGIIGTINSYYKFSTRAAQHQMVSQLYMKTYKKLEIELSLPINQRQNAGELLKELRDQMERIGEMSPEVPEAIIKLYKTEFKSSLTAKPIITNGLDPIKVYREASAPTPEPAPQRPVIRVEV